MKHGPNFGTRPQVMMPLSKLLLLLLDLNTVEGQGHGSIALNSQSIRTVVNFYIAREASFRGLVFIILSGFFNSFCYFL
jgi:hypothetical protein